jgi:excisionase family DNA binding protein
VITETGGNSVNTPETVPLTEIRQRLGIGRDAVYLGIQRGQIPGHKLGGKIVVPRAHFENWMAGKPTSTRPRLPSGVSSPFLRRLPLDDE